MFHSITYEEFDPGYAIIKLNRPDKLNAVSKKMAEELRAALRQAKENEKLKCLVITGAGNRAFCAGGDLKDFHGEMDAGEAFQLLYPMKEVLYELASFPMPTIALLNGQARGGGCEIATACDFRIGVEGAEFGFVQGQLGIIPGWGGGALLYEKIRPERAYLWLTEATMYDYKKAYDIGWLHHIITKSELENIESLLQQFLNKSLLQLSHLKQQYEKKLSMLSLSSMMDEEVRVCARLWESEEHKQAVELFLKSRK
ncbi:enoyl-CoA hydratase/isomerase family protein [Thalassobacillus pellis]|uniref:enoyl-CoA hydratase/isomerase family protein n=1 Tax=Thalassobacillus pellis TaxID=748008 RepID=UPI001961A8D3|nr:enoyl-CoA hydratase/isomerase family protein [Thalassobacillus pellis]MBM7552866.1 enoyl-CoA hydratase/carnithine racemase [Thalassobacillus pellis]